MSETDAIKSNYNEDEAYLKKEKDIAFHTMCLDAWKDTRMEVDKSLLNLSAGAIGLLITLFLTFGVKTLIESIIYSVTCLAFIITIFITLFILDKNAIYLEKVIKDIDPGRTLKILDYLKKITFGVGILSFVAIAIIIGIKNYNQFKENNMNDKKQNTQEISKRSLDGISKLKPLPAQPSKPANKNPKPTK